MNDQATLLKWAQLLPTTNGREACAKLLEAVSQQRLDLVAIHQAGLLQPLCSALRSKDPSLQQRAVAVLLEASRCGPGGEVQLAAAPGCCQALLDIVATNLPVHSSVFEVPPHHHQQQQQQQQQELGGANTVSADVVDPASASTSTDATQSSSRARSSLLVQVPHSSKSVAPVPQHPDGQQGPLPWEDVHEAARAACNLLWRISSDGEAREVLMAGTSALVPVLMVLLGTPSVTLRMASSGTLCNLSQAPRVQQQMASRAQELVPILVGLLARAGSDLLAAIGVSPAALANMDSVSLSASSRTSPDVSPRHPAHGAVAASQPPLASPAQPVRRSSSVAPTQAQEPPQQQLPHPFLHQQMLIHAGPMPPGRNDGRGTGASGAGWAVSQPTSPYGFTIPTTGATSSNAEAVALTLANVAGLLRVLCCHAAVAAAMIAHEGQPIRRLLRAMSVAGCTAAALYRQQQVQQATLPLLDHLTRFQVLCGGAIAALAGHPPTSSVATVSSGGAAAMAGSGGHLGSPQGPASPSAGFVAPAVMTALYVCCREADPAGLSALMANQGVAIALALSLQYGGKALGAEIAVSVPHPNSQSWPWPGSTGTSGATAGGTASLESGTPGAAGAAAAAGVQGGSGPPAEGSGAPNPAFLDPAGSLGAAVFAMHTLRIVASSAAATEALVASDCGALSIVRTLSYFLLHRSMEQRMPLDEEAFAMQALASGTLARLAEQPAARAAPAVREGLTPPLEVLSALALLLLLPPGPPPPLIWGTAAGENAGAAARCFVASLLAAVALHGPYTYDVFTQVIINTRGALGTIISLLSAPNATGSVSRVDRETPQHQHLPQAVSSTAETTRVSGNTAGSPAGISSATRPESAVGTGAHGTGGPYDDAAVAGVEAALALCTVAAHNREVARVLASKTTLVPTLLAVLRERRSSLAPSSDLQGSHGWQWHGMLRVRVLKLLSTLTLQLGETSVRSELVADAGLMPALLHCMSPQQPPEVVKAALDWLAQLLQYPTFMQDRMQGPTVNEVLGRILELLQLLPHASGAAAGPLTPSRAVSLTALLSISGNTTPSSGTLNASAAGTLAAAVAVVSAAGASPSSRTVKLHQQAVATSSGLGASGPVSSARAGASARNAGGRPEAPAPADGSSSLNNSLRGNTNRVGATGPSPAAAQDWAAFNPAATAAAAMALYRLAAASFTIRNQLCGIPGLVSGVLRQVHGLLDHLAADGYVLPAVTATRLSGLLATLGVLAGAGAPTGLDPPLRALQRKFSALSSENGRWQFRIPSSNGYDASQTSGTASSAEGPAAGEGVGVNGGSTRGAGAPLPGSGAGMGDSERIDALRQMLDAPYSFDVLCEAIDAMHAVLEAEERSQQSRTAGQIGGPPSAGAKGVGTPSRVALMAYYSGGGSGNADSPAATDTSHGASPSRIHLTSARPTLFSSGGSTLSQWPMQQVKGVDVQGGPQEGNGGLGSPWASGSPWTVRDASPGTAGPSSPTKRHRLHSQGGADFFAASAWGTSASLPAPIERATAVQMADIRTHALGVLQKLVGFWSATARIDVELADALPGLLAELEVEIRGTSAVTAGTTRNSMMSSNGAEVLRLDAGSTHAAQPPAASRSSRPSRMAASLPPLPPPLPPQLGDVVMLSRGRDRRGNVRDTPAVLEGSGQPVTTLLRRVVQVCCKLMVPSEPARLRDYATNVVATVMSLSDELSAVLVLTLPQLLDRLLDVIGLMAGSEGVAVACSQKEDGGGLAFAPGPSVAAAAAASVMQLRKQGRGDGGEASGTGVTTAGGMVGELQGNLQLDAESSLTALDVLLRLAHNGWAQERLANHPRLAEALDLLLHEDAVVTLRALLETTAQQPPAGVHHAGQHQQTANGGRGVVDAGADGGPSSRGSTGEGTSHTRSSGTGTQVPSGAAQSLSLASSGSLMTGSVGITDIRAVAAQLVVTLAPHTNRTLLPAPGSGNSGLISALDALLREGSRGLQRLSLSALWSLVASPGGAAMVAVTVVPRSLVALLRQQGPSDAAIRTQAVGVLAALVQRLDSGAATSLASVEGLAGALLEVMAASAELLARCVRASGGSAGPAASTGQGSSPKAPTSLSAFGGGSGHFFASSGELPDVGVLDQAAHQLLWSVTAVAGLSRSAAVAARFASLKALQPTLLAALKIRPLDIQLYASGLVGNLTAHTATAAIVAGVRGVGRELVRQLREAKLEPENPHLQMMLAAVRNLASSERGRQELASDPATVPSLVRALTSVSSGSAPEGVSPPQGDVTTPYALAVQLAVIAALCNLSGDRCGLEAMVADQELLLPVLWALVRSLVTSQPQTSGSTLPAHTAGEWVLNRHVNSRLRLFVCVLLANTMSHPVLAKTSLTLHDGMANLVALVLALPSPSRHAAQQDPLAPMRSRRHRMAYVAVLDGLKQLLVSVGPRALHSLQGRPVKANAATAASSTTGGPVPSGPPAPGPGAPGSPARLARLVDHVVDLLAWVDFHSAEEVAGDPANAGIGADVAGAAAGVVGQLAVLGVVGRFPEYANVCCQSLVKLMVLPTLQPISYGRGGSAMVGGSIPPGVLDVAAGHAAAAVWAVVSNPQCQAWAQQVQTDTAAQRVMLLLVRRGTRGGTRARFATARVFAATTLGQLVVQGGVTSSELPELVAPENGLPGALLDLATLSVPSSGTSSSPAGPQQPTMQHQAAIANPGTGVGAGRGKSERAPLHAGVERHPGTGPMQAAGGAPGGAGAYGHGGPGGGAGTRQPRAKDVDPLEQARASALAMVGASGDMRLTLGLQAMGALAHLAGEPGGAAALLQLPGLLEVTARLLNCPIGDVSGVAAMLLSTLSSNGGSQASMAITNSSAGLVDSLLKALKSKEMQVRAYCAIVLANLASSTLQAASPDLQLDTNFPATTAATDHMDLVLGSGALECLISMLAECGKQLVLCWAHMPLGVHPARQDDVALVPDQVDGPHSAAVMGSLVMPLATPQVAPLGSTGAPTSTGSRPGGHRQRQQAAKSEPKQPSVQGASGSAGPPPSTPNSKPAPSCTRGGLPTASSDQEALPASDAPDLELNPNTNWIELEPFLTAAAAAAGAIQNLSAGYSAICASLIHRQPEASAGGQQEAAKDPIVVQSFGDWVRNSSPPSPAGSTSSGKHVRQEFFSSSVSFLDTAVGLLSICYKLLDSYHKLEQLGVLPGAAELVHAQASPSGSTASPVAPLVRLVILVLGILANLSATWEGRDALLGLIAAECQAPPNPIVPGRDEDVASPSRAQSMGANPSVGARDSLASCLAHFLSLPTTAAAKESLLNPATVDMGFRQRHHADDLYHGMVPQKVSSTGGRQRVSGRYPGAPDGADGVDGVDAAAHDLIRLLVLGLCCNLLSEPQQMKPQAEASFWDDAKALEKELSGSPSSGATKSSAPAAGASRGETSVLAQSPAMIGPHELSYGSVVFQRALSGDSTAIESIAEAWPSVAFAGRPADEGWEMVAREAGVDAVTKDGRCSKNPEEKRKPDALEVPGAPSSAAPPPCTQAAGKEVLLQVLRRKNVRSVLRGFGLALQSREKRLFHHMVGWLEQVLCEDGRAV